jgi:hypothetical protein
MPARKPASLHTKHYSTASAASRKRAEEATNPGAPLPITPPTLLKGCRIARAAWRHLVRMNLRMETPLFSSLDRDLVIEYCLSLEYLADLRELRAQALRAGDVDQVLKVDARLDRKSSLLQTMRQALLLTPRARSGVSPASKPKDWQDEANEHAAWLEKILDEDGSNGRKN